MADKTRIAALIVFILSFIACPGCMKNPSVKRPTPSGPVIGIVEKNVEIFRGIPYAEPPMGENRWKEPRPVRQWKEDLPCREFRPACIQPQVSELDGGGEVGRTSEDCLYLNIWAPEKAAGKPLLPVMVWIHGGAFMTGAGSLAGYSGAGLAREGVVVVTLNYRLGPFGFLAHPALSAESPSGTSGNYGILDQMEALRWVKKNIASFGGDPERVTLFGESAGALSISALLLSPSAQGLFHRAILQSGAPTGNRYVMPAAHGSMREALTMGKELAARLGSDKEKDVAGAMRRKTPEEIMSAAATSLEFIFKKEGLLFAPVIDGRLLPAEPERLLSEGKIPHIPLIVGTNRDEASLFTDGLSPALYQSWLRENFGNPAEEILRLFPLDEKEGIDSPSNRFLGALWFFGPARSLARAVARKGGKAYLYSFTHVPEKGLLKEYGAFHGQEIEYVFGNLGIILPTDYDRSLSRTMMEYWVAFAATGDPNARRLPRWPAYDEKKDVSMELGAIVGPRAGLSKKECDFVEKLRYGGKDKGR
ncbi:MAG TPA: carboxylesterase/lipase family protein [Syntrophorhabdaceae bacterium]|jgi:para-nitrobenzyl esterase